MYTASGVGGKLIGVTGEHGGAEHGTLSAPSPPAKAQTSRGWRATLALILLIGLAIRLVILAGFSETGLQVADERHYHMLGSSLADGDGFAWGPGRPTSIRPPLYPAALAGAWTVMGTRSLQLIRSIQVVLSLSTVVLVFILARRLYNDQVGLFAAAGVCFYPTLIIYNFLILTEVLFTLLLVLSAIGYLEMLRWGEQRLPVAVLTGFALGLASLTRSVLWLYPLLLCTIIVATAPGRRRTKAVLAIAILVGYAIPVAPWAMRNTALQKVPVVIDTMGGLNLRLGNYEHTPDERMWDAISLTGQKMWAYEMWAEAPESRWWTEGQKDRWARQRAFRYMTEHPWETARRMLIKFSDFWGLEREFVAGLQLEYYSPGRAISILTIALITISYSMTMLLACCGIFLAAPKDMRTHAFALLTILFVCGIHTVVYGHSRYHVPLMPFLIIYGAAALCERRRLWTEVTIREALPTIASILVLVICWGRELLVDEGRIRALLQAIW